MLRYQCKIVVNKEYCFAGTGSYWRTLGASGYALSHSITVISTFSVIVSIANKRPNRAKGRYLWRCSGTNLQQDDDLTLRYQGVAQLSALYS